MVEEYHQKGRTFFNEEDHKIYKFYDIDRNAKEEDKIHNIKRKNGYIELNTEDIEIEKYKKKLNFQDNKTLRKKDRIYIYIILLLFIISLGFFIKEIVVMNKHSDEYLKNLMKNINFKDIKNWYKVKEDSKSVNILSVLIVLLTGIVLSAIINYLFQLINAKTLKIQKYLSISLYFLGISILLALILLFCYSSLHKYLIEDDTFSHLPYHEETFTFYKIIKAPYFWIKEIILWIIHIKIAIDLVTICLVLGLCGRKSFKNFSDTAIYINTYIKHSEKSFLIRFIGYFISQLVGTIFLGIPVFVLYSYFITYKEKEEYIEAKKESFFGDISYLFDKKYFLYALSNIFCIISIPIINAFLNVILNYIKCSITGSYSEQYLEEIRDVDCTSKNRETNLMKKYLKVSLSCLGSICHDSLNFIEIIIYDILLAVVLIFESINFLSDEIKENKNTAKIGHTEHYYTKITERKGHTSVEDCCDIENLIDGEYYGKLNDESYQRYVNVLGECSYFLNSFFSNYIDILFTDKSFNQAHEDSYAETFDIFIPLIVTLMRIFSSFICSFLVTIICCALNYIINGNFFNILSLIIFSVEFLKTYISNHLFAYGPQIAKICTLKNNKLFYDQYNTIYVLSEYIEDE